MKRTFIAGVLSLGLAATTITVAPARADEDVLKVIAGLVVLGTIANAAKHRNERKANHTTRSYQQPIYQQPRQQRHPKTARQHRRVKAAPHRCLRNQWTHSGEREVYSARCMQKHARAQLPQSCLRQARTNSGPRYFYTKRCLSNNGWRI